MIKNEELLEKSSKLADNVGFLLNGGNILVGIFAIIYCLKQMIEQQDVINVDTVCDFIKDTSKGKERND